jgi:hypothetical protein
MKCKTVLELGCVIDERTPESYRPKFVFKAVKGNLTPVTVWPVGTEFGDEQPPVTVKQDNEGTVIPHSLFMCLIGQAHPSDAECLQATGKTEAELRAIQAAYHLAHTGYHKKQDHELAMQGVILGYDAEGKPIPGPNWEQYQKAKEELEKEDEI